MVASIAVWKYTTLPSGETRVCASSENFYGNCFGTATAGVAGATCRSVGARLCSEEELRAGVGMNTGCGYNSHWLWTSTVCSATDGGTGRVVVAQETNVQCLTALPNVSAHIRCCGDDTAFVPATTDVPVSGVQLGTGDEDSTRQQGLGTSKTVVIAIVSAVVNVLLVAFIGTSMARSGNTTSVLCHGAFLNRTCVGDGLC